jgi:DNA-binding CsgD family transcriptional regulator/PAS domain-containing protein
MYDMVRGDGHAPAIDGLDPALMPLFDQHYVVNPWTDLMRERAVIGVPIPTEPYIDARALHRTGFHHDILAPQRIVGQTFHQLRRDGRFTVGLALMHTEPGRATRPDVLRLLRRMGRHLDIAFELMHRLDTLSRRLDDAEDALEDQRCAMFILDAQGSIRHANRRARRLLADGDALVSVGHRLGARRPDDAQALAKLLQTCAAAPAAPGARSLSLPRGPLRLPLLAVALPCVERHRLADAAGRAEPRDVMLFVADPSERGDVAADLLCDAFALTDRELSVCLAVVRLGSVPAAAAELRIAPSTARSHLQHVFDKTGTRHQVALAQLVASLGALPDVAG